MIHCKFKFCFLELSEPSYFLNISYLQLVKSVDVKPTDTGADHAWMNPAHSSALFAKEPKGSDMQETITPATQILIPTELHPCTALSIFLLTLGIMVYSFYPD